jgi:Tol biopolymer transport system component/DNA-binding winged helix-turn-helix (wHTH) protein
MNPSAPRFYDFGPFRVDTADRRLFRNGDEVPLAPKTFETLQVLLEKYGQLVSKDEMMERLWPGTFVGEDALAQKISLLRKALDEGNGSQGYISTVPKLGYRFVGVIRKSPPGDAIVVVPTGSELDAPPTASVHIAKWTRNLWQIAVAFLILGVGFGWLASRRSPPKSHTDYQINKLDVSNPANFGIISPAGKYVAYASVMDGKESLWVRPVAAFGKGLEVVSSIGGSLWGLTYSPDEAYLYYVVGGPPLYRGTLYRINSLGGSPQRLLEGIDGAVAFEPDGQHLVYKRFTNSTHSEAAELVVARADGTDVRPIARSDARYPFYSYHWPAADKIVYSQGQLTSARGIDWYVAEISSDGGAESRIFGPRPAPIKFVQTVNPTEFIALADDPQSGLGQVWVFYRNGETRRVTNDTNQYVLLSVASTVHRMLATRVETEDSLWIADASQTPSERTAALNPKEINLSQGSYEHPVWTPDGNIVYAAASEGRNKQLCWVTANGVGQRRLTSNGGDKGNQEVSPDGKFVAYTSDSNGLKNIWQVDIDGSNPRQLTSGGNDNSAVVSPDGKWVFYNSLSASGWGIWKVPSGGGTTVKVADSVQTTPRISPDGKWIEFEHVSAETHQRRWGIFSYEDLSLRTEIDLPEEISAVNWSPDSKSLLYLLRKESLHSLWIQPITGQAPKMIMNLSSFAAAYVDWSSDGSKIVLDRRNPKVGLVLIDETK